MQDRRIRVFPVILAVLFLCPFLCGCRCDEADTLAEAGLHEETGVQEDKEQEKEPEEDGAEDTASDKDTGETGTKTGQEADTVFVYMCGAVAAPGVYELKSGARVYEAIRLAGGVTAEAAQEVLNQARVVTDGERIYVPTVKEVADGTYTDDGAAKDSTADGVGDGPQSSENNTQGKININTAGKEDLMTLTGIGNAKAESIIRYREDNGSFQSIEEIMQVEGIKEGVFNKIKDKITV